MHTIKERVTAAIETSLRDQKPVMLETDITRRQVMEVLMNSDYVIDCQLTGGIYDIKGWPLGSTSDIESWNILTLT